MVEHVTVNHMMRVRFPRGTRIYKLSNIKVLYLFAKQEVWVQFPSQLLSIVVEWQTLHIQAMAFEGSSPSDGKKNGNSLMVERYIVTIKMWVQFPFTTKNKSKLNGPIA